MLRQDVPQPLLVALLQAVYDGRGDQVIHLCSQGFADNHAEVVQPVCVVEPVSRVLVVVEGLHGLHESRDRDFQKDIRSSFTECLFLASRSNEASVSSSQVMMHLGELERCLLYADCIGVLK